MIKFVGGLICCSLFAFAGGRGTYQVPYGASSMAIEPLNLNAGQHAYCQPQIGEINHHLVVMGGDLVCSIKDGKEMEYNCRTKGGCVAQLIIAE